MSIIDNIKIRHGIDKDGKYFFEKEPQKSEPRIEYKDGCKITYSENWVTWEPVKLLPGGLIYINPTTKIVTLKNRKEITTDSNQNPVTKENFNSSFAAKAIENRLGVKRGESTETATSVTGEKYICFAGNSIKEEGQLIQGWQETAHDAWEIFIRTIEEHYFNLTENHKIYWRQKPRLEFYFERQAYAVYARFLISDKPKIAVKTEKISNDTWVETLGINCANCAPRCKECGG